VRALVALILGVAALFPVIAHATTDQPGGDLSYSLKDARAGAQLRAEAAILMPIIFDPCGSTPAMQPVKERFGAMLHGITQDRHKFDVVIARSDYDYQMSLVDIACPELTTEQQAEADKLEASVANSVMDRIETLLAKSAERGELSIFVLACFVGYYVVWSVTPALHTPLMAVTNAISSVIIVGALIAAAEATSPLAKWLGLAGVVMASINIFGGFAVTERMLAMYKKKEK